MSMTKQQAIEEMTKLGYGPRDYYIQVTDGDQCEITFAGDSTDEAFRGNTWDDVISDIVSAYA